MKIFSVKGIISVLFLLTIILFVVIRIVNINSIDQGKNFELYKNPSPSLKPVSVLPPANFQKRLFRPEDAILSDIFYPAEITNIPVSQLVGLDCKRFINDGYGDKAKNKPDYYLNYSYSVTDPKNGLPVAYPMNHKRYIELFLKASNDSPKYNLRSITFCEVEDNRLFVEYETAPKDTQAQSNSQFLGFIQTAYAGGGGGSDVYIAEATKENGLRMIVYLPVQKAAYWGCYSPLELTGNNIFYWRCGGGDGGGPGSFLINIYKIDINARAYSEILTCTNVFTADNKIQNQCKS